MDDRTLAGRLLAIVAAVAQSDDHIALAQLTRATGIPKPSVMRIANDLVARGVLIRDRGGYRLGLALAHVGLRAFAQNGFRSAAMPYLQELFDRTRQMAWVVAVHEDEQ